MHTVYVRVNGKGQYVQYQVGRVLGRGNGRGTGRGSGSGSGSGRGWIKEVWCYMCREWMKCMLYVYESVGKDSLCNSR